jgi:hypothetical protein
MRFKIFNKGSLVSTVFGLSKSPEKNFGRTYVCIQEKGNIYKILSVLASKKDGSLSVFFNYCKEKKAFVFRHRHEYKPGLQYIDETKITDEFEIGFDVDNTAKFSLHRSGFVQLSGKGILSGIDTETGRPKGVGVFSSRLDTPVSSGPTFVFTCWGLQNGFELLERPNSKDQYVVLKEQDFEKRYVEKDKPLNSYVLEFFIFPKEANKFVYEHEGRPYINHVMHNYLHKLGMLSAHPVLDIRFFEEVIAVFPSKQWTGFHEKSGCGYSLGSPGGSDNQFDKKKSGYNFHLICPMDTSHSLLGSNKIKTLEHKFKSSK